MNNVVMKTLEPVSIEEVKLAHAMSGDQFDLCIAVHTPNLSRDSVLTSVYTDTTSKKSRVIPFGKVNEAHDKPSHIDFQTLNSVKKKYGLVDLDWSVMWAFRPTCGIDAIKRASCRLVWEQLGCFVKSKQSLGSVKIFKRTNPRTKRVEFIFLFINVEVVDVYSKKVEMPQRQCFIPDTRLGVYTFTYFIEKNKTDGMGGLSAELLSYV